MMIKRWLAGGALLALAALPAANGDVHIGALAADGGVVANDLPPDNTQAKH